MTFVLLMLTSRIPLADGIDHMPEVVAGEPVVRGQAERLVHDTVAFGQAIGWLTMTDVCEAWLAQDVARPDHPGRNVPRQEMLLCCDAVDARSQHEWVAHPRRLDAVDESRPQHLVFVLGHRLVEH